MLSLSHPIDSETLEAYVLGHLGPKEEAELEEHLLVCQQCCEALGAVEEDVLSMKELLREMVSEG